MVWLQLPLSHHHLRLHPVVRVRRLPLPIQVLLFLHAHHRLVVVPVARRRSQVPVYHHQVAVHPAVVPVHQVSLHLAVQVARHHFHQVLLQHHGVRVAAASVHVPAHSVPHQAVHPHSAPAVHPHIHVPHLHLHSAAVRLPQATM